MQLGTTVIENMTVVVHPVHLCQYPILGLTFGGEGKVTDDLRTGWNEFLLNVSPGFCHLGFDFGGYGRRGPLWRVQVSAPTGQCSAKLMAAHLGKPTPSLSESFESPPGPDVSQGFDSVFDHDVEEKYGPGAIVGSIESRLEQREKADETLHRHRAIDRVHFDHRVGNERRRMEVSVKPRGRAVGILYDVFSEICRHGASVPQHREADSGGGGGIPRQPVSLWYPGEMNSTQA